MLFVTTGLRRADVIEDELQVSMELDSTEMIKQFVMAGLGISFLAASHCQAEVESGKVVCVSLAPEPAGSAAAPI